MLVFEEREKPEYPKKNLLGTPNSTHIWRQSEGIEPGPYLLGQVLEPTLSFTVSFSLRILQFVCINLRTEPPFPSAYSFCASPDCPRTVL